MNAKTGGQAFPRTRRDGDMCSSLDVEGMTLRDYFAGKVLQAIVLNQEKDPSKLASDTAELCYIYADAMLKARES